MKQALRYIKNTNGGATKAIFIEDHEPLGDILWDEVIEAGLAGLDDDGIVWLTPDGIAYLGEA